MKSLLITPLFLFVSFVATAQLLVDKHPTEDYMIMKNLIGDSTIKVKNVNYTGPHDARALFYSKNTTLGLSEGILITTGDAQGAIGPNDRRDYTVANQVKGDADLHYLAGYKTYDATILSFEFEAQTDLIRFNYVFASEEYPEYVGSPFNDVFGFFLTDIKTGEMWNLAVLPNTEIPVTVNSINHRTNSDYFRSNTTENGGDHIQFDGMTTPMIAFHEVVPGRRYRIKIAIADVGDNALDSGVFIEGGSFKSENKEDFYRENQAYLSDFGRPEEKMVHTSTPPPRLEIDQENITNDSLDMGGAIDPPPAAKGPSYAKAPDSLVVYFDYDVKSPQANSMKNALAQMENIDPSKYDLVVKGHTDQNGTDGYNQRLSESRSSNVIQRIKSTYPNFNIIQQKGYSFHQLVDTKTDANSRAKNRRVVIYFKEK